MNNHYNITPISAKIKNSFLYQNDESSELTKYTDCKIFSICTYLNEVITFDVILDDGSIFNYVPLHVIFSDTPKEIFNLKDLVYHNCLSLDASIQYFDILKTMHGYAYFKNKIDFRKISKYIMTIDFYKSNEILHLCVLDNNNFVLLPNHKILFFEEEQDPALLKFKQYKKVRGIFKV